MPTPFSHPEVLVFHCIEWYPNHKGFNWRDLQVIMERCFPLIPEEQPWSKLTDLSSHRWPTIRPCTWRCVKVVGWSWSEILTVPYSVTWISMLVVTRDLQTSANSRERVRLPFLSTRMTTRFLTQWVYYFAGWHKYVNGRIKVWETFYTTWITEGTRVHVTKFEDLADNATMIDSLRSIVEFLGLPKLDDGRLGCLRSHMEGRFHRKKCGGKTTEASVKQGKYLHDIFTADQKKIIDEAIARLNDAIAEHLPDQTVNLNDYKSTVVDYCHWLLLIMATPIRFLCDHVFLLG